MCSDQFELLGTCFCGALMKVMGCIIAQEVLACTHFKDLPIDYMRHNMGKGSIAP